MSTVSKSPALHHERLISHLEDVAAGRCDRLMVQMPPGSAKSTYGSVLFPAYFFGSQPSGQIIATAHTASLANYFGRQARSVIAEHGGLIGIAIAKESRASSRFSVETGGEYFAAGVHGPITGRRADLILIDDPIKSWAEAESQKSRDGLYEWYRAELTARLKPNGRIVLLMTRWHEDDLAGRLTRAESGWTYLTLPALAEAEDPLARLPGAALWPEWQDEAALQRRCREVGDRVFAAMYQQNPRPPGGAIFNTKMIGILPELPVLVRTIRAWDLAASLPGPGRNPDYTVGLKLGEITRSQFVVMNVIRIQATPGDVQAKILSTAQADGVATIVALPQDPGQAGAAQIATLRGNLDGYRVAASPETGSKQVRAKLAEMLIDGGKISLLAAPWNENFLAELAAFPDSQKDDQVDALSRALNTLANLNAAKTKQMRVPLLDR